MRYRVWFFVMMAVLTLIPATVAGQPSPPPGANAFAFDAALLGEGWVQRSDSEPVLLPLNDRVRMLFVGPEGARVAIDVYVLGVTTSEITANWPALFLAWHTTASSLEGIEDVDRDRVTTFQTSLPDGITDANVIHGYHPWNGENVGLGLYVYRHAVAFMVTAEGIIDGRVGVEAANAVVGLLVDALGS
jgi:hypothetical protein